MKIYKRAQAVTNTSFNKMKTALLFLFSIVCCKGSIDLSISCSGDTPSILKPTERAGFGAPGKRGPIGPPGPDGPQGSKGEAGSSCQCQDIQDLKQQMAEMQEKMAENKRTAEQRRQETRREEQNRREECGCAELVISRHQLQLLLLEPWCP